MKWTLVLLFVFTLLTGCTSYHPPKDRTIAIQPLGEIQSVSLNEISKTIAHFYHCNVMILPAIALPKEFSNYEKGERYSSDSLVHYLSKRNNDTVLLTIGITEKDIFCTKYEVDGSIKKPENKYRIFGIFGLGTVSGNSCVVSVHRLKNNSLSLFMERVTKVVLHEIGHNLGLQHCPNAGCLMGSAKESIATVDAEAVALCASCMHKIK